MSPRHTAPDWGTFELAPEEVKPRMVIRSWGLPKTGKNNLGLGGPGPVAVHCFDLYGMDGVVEKYRKAGKEVYVKKYHFSGKDKRSDNSADRAKEIRDAFLEDLEISRKNARTVQVDETEIFEVFRYAEFGDKSDNPNNYDKLYADYREWLYSFEDTDCNLQLIQKVKEKWDQVEGTDRNGRPVTRGKPSGQMRSTGYKDLYYVVKMNLEHVWDEDKKLFMVRVENCSYNMSLAGSVLTLGNDEGLLGVDAFTDLACAVFEETSKEDWE